MNKDQVRGRLKETKGYVNEIAGKVFGSDRLMGDGAAEKAAGQARAEYGNVKSAATRKR